MSRHILEQDGAAARYRRVPFWTDLAQIFVVAVAIIMFALTLYGMFAVMRDISPGVASDLSVDIY